MHKNTWSHEYHLIKVEKALTEIIVILSFVYMIENQKIVLNDIIDIQR